VVDIDGSSTIKLLSNREYPNQMINYRLFKKDPVPRSNAYGTRSICSCSSSSILQFCLILVYVPYSEQEVLGRTNRMLSLHTTRTA
jgi:hypothetical protein